MRQQGPKVFPAAHVGTQKGELLGEETTGTSRWDGKTLKVDARGREVPDDAARTATTRLLNLRPAIWPKADYIIGNPPFLGNASMLGNVGVGYTEALRATYPDLPDTVDFVLYWWHKAAWEVRSGRARRFGLITTNSLRQVRQRGVIAFHLSPSSRLENKKQKVSQDEGDAGDEKPPLKLLWAIPDHPWAGEGAAVAEAYGWDAGLPEPDILERLVALNQARAAEESKGQIRWLRPEYQAPG